MCKRERRRKKRKMKMAAALLALAGVGAFSILMVRIAFAAPEDPAVERLAEKAAKEEMLRREKAAEPGEWMDGCSETAETSAGAGGRGEAAEQGKGADGRSEAAETREGADGRSEAAEPGKGTDVRGEAVEPGAGTDAPSEAAEPKEWADDRGEAAEPGAGIAVVPPKKSGVPLIVVDPGHGGIDEGCSFQGVLEKDINLSIALALQKKLEALGYQVLMTRSDDTYVAKEERARLANRNRADAYISIHQNIYEDRSVKGVETWYDGTDAARDCKRLAQLVHKYVLQRTNATERELKGDAQFAVTGQTQMPACLIETGFLSNDEERSLLLTAEYQEELAAGIADGIELYFHPKTMYLTFDDGPSAENTDKVLDILKERGIKATFFLVGENVRRYPEVAKRIAAEGHTIGIHCDTHDYKAIYASADSYLQDFEKAYRTVQEVTGVEAKLFRFPGGSVNAYNGDVCRRIAEEMTDRGFIYYDWNASLEDAVKKSTPQQLIENAVESTLGRKKVVMLAHDVVGNTALCLEELLDQFPEYQMKPLSEWNEPIQFPMP